MRNTVARRLRREIHAKGIWGAPGRRLYRKRKREYARGERR